MISFGSQTRVFVATEPVDFRRGVHGLVAMVAEELKGDPYSGDVFVFRSKRADRLKFLVFDGTGMILATKWLEESRFTWPPIRAGTMRFVAVKTEEQQGRAMLFRTRDLFVRQRTQLINALRGHLSEHGVVAAQGPTNVKVFAEAIEEAALPLLILQLARVFLDQIEGLSKRISELEKVTIHEAASGEATRRLQTMPGVGPIAALAIETFAPPMSIFKRGRDFAAWLGLVPRQHSTPGQAGSR